MDRVRCCDGLRDRSLDELCEALSENDPSSVSSVSSPRRCRRPRLRIWRTHLSPSSAFSLAVCSPFSSPTSFATFPTLPVWACFFGAPLGLSVRVVAMVEVGKKNTLTLDSCCRCCAILRYYFFITNKHTRTRGNESAKQINVYLFIVYHGETVTYRFAKYQEETINH